MTQIYHKILKPHLFTANSKPEVHGHLMKKNTSFYSSLHKYVACCTVLLIYLTLFMQKY